MYYNLSIRFIQNENAEWIDNVYSCYKFNNTYLHTNKAMDECGQIVECPQKYGKY